MRRFLTMIISTRRFFVLFLFSVEPSTSFFQSQLSSCRVAVRSLSSDKWWKSTILHLSTPNDEKQTPKSLSASQVERREEDRRRKARLQEGFATPGLSSALPGARDFALNIAQTEQEYLQSLSSSDDDSVIDERNVDKYVALWTEEGLSHLRMLRFREASELFNKVYQIKPEAYLWQDGMVKYYLGDYHGAAESLAKNAMRYESRFMEPASEERIWRDAAELKIVYNLNGGRVMKNGFPATIRVSVEEEIDEEQSEKISIASERRKVIRLARQLFSNSIRNNDAGVALARAQLQAICGGSFPSALKSTLPTMPKSEPSPPFNAQPDRKMYNFHSLFYLGLHYDALGQSHESKQCMKMALKTFANKISGNSQDITYLLPVIHMTVRDWYDDDDDFDVDASDPASYDPTSEVVNDGEAELELRKGVENTRSSYVRVGSERVQRLRESIQNMRAVDLKNELKRRNLRVSGSKKELQDRLIDAYLINDASAT